MGVSAVKLTVMVLLLGLSTVAAARPDSPGSTDMYRFAVGDVVEHVDSAGGHVRVFFTRSGVNAVPAVDTDVNGTPDDVDQVAQLYEDVLAFYTGRGYQAPLSDALLADNGGDGRFDVYLVDFAGKADGIFVRQGCGADNRCSGYMVQENDFAGYGYPSLTYANRVLSSHEFFHAVQASYDNSESTVFLEGTAVWATEQFDASLKDFEGFVGGYLSRPSHSLDLPLPGPVDAFSYGAAIFFQYLGEKYGPVVIRELWEAADGTPTWFDAVDGVLKTHHSSFADAFFGFARWNLFTGKRADPTQSYAAGAGYPLLTVEAGTFPVNTPSLRVFESATSYLAVPVSGRTTVTTSLVMPAGSDGSPLRFAVALRKGNVVSAPVVADFTLPIIVDSTGADEVLIVVSNTAQSGESLKPGLCAGSSDEVDACRVQLGAMPLSMAPTPPKKDGCNATGGTPGVDSVLWVAGLIAWRRRRYS